MKRNNKKGFTIVELTIVIAVIAILAAVLIPTFSSVVDKANQSADVQLVRQANVVLQAATADGSSLTKAEAEKELKSNSITLGTPSGSDNAFYYLEGENRYVLFNTETDKITYPEDLANKPLVTLWVSETEQYYLLADSENPLTKVPVPTLDGKTFMGYFADKNMVDLNHEFKSDMPIRLQLMDFIRYTNWKMTTKGDAGRLFYAEIITSGSAQSIDFNDQNLNQVDYETVQLDNGEYKYILKFEISKNMVSPGEHCDYEKNVRFIDFNGAPIKKVIKVSLGGVGYYDQNAAWTDLANFGNENITLYAHWK